MKNTKTQKTIIQIAGIIAFFAVGFIFASCATTSGVPLAAPQNVTAVETEVVPPYRYITVNWLPVEGAESYRVDFFVTGGSTYTREVNGTSFRADFHPGEEVHFVITALRGRRGEGEKSDKVTVTTSAETEEDIEARAQRADRAAETAEANRIANEARAAEAEAARIAEAARVAAIENSFNFQHLIGTWRKVRDTITFPESLNDYFYSDLRSGGITSFTPDSITVDFGGGSLGILTFNYTISGDSLIISNWTLGGFAIDDMDGVYTRER